MYINGTLKQNSENSKKPNDFNFRGSKYISMKNVEDITAKKEEVIKEYKEKLGNSSSLKIVEKDGHYNLYYTLFVKEEDLDERVKNQLKIVGEKGLVSSFNTKTNKVDNITSPILSNEGVGKILNKNIKPEKLKEDEQIVTFKGNLITSKQDEKEKKSLAIKIPVMNKNGEQYSDKTIEELKEILNSMGLYGKIEKYEEKISLVIYVSLANTDKLKELEDQLEEGKNFVSISLNAFGLLNSKPNYLIEGKQIIKKEENNEELETKERPKIPTF